MTKWMKKFNNWLEKQKIKRTGLHKEAVLEKINKLFVETLENRGVDTNNKKELA